MKNEKIIEAFNEVNPCESKKDEVLFNMLNEKKKNSKVINFKRFLPAAALIILALAAAPAVIKSHSAPDKIVPVTAAEESPVGIRKFLNYGGHRYAFIENGTTYDLSAIKLSPIGTLSIDFTENPAENKLKDFATTFAKGGTLYEMENYNPLFRLAVELDGNYYICENTDNLDGSDVIISDIFSAADFKNTTESISVYDHFKRSELGLIERKAVNEMLDLIEKAVPHSFTNEEFAAIGAAQSGGKSFQLRLNLADGTSYKIYAIPSLNVIMMGDNRYLLPDEYSAEFGSYFEGMEQEAFPIQ